MTDAGRIWWRGFMVGTAVGILFVAAFGLNDLPLWKEIVLGVSVVCAVIVVELELLVFACRYIMGKLPA